MDVAFPGIYLDYELAIVRKPREFETFDNLLLGPLRIDLHEPRARDFVLTKQVRDSVAAYPRPWDYACLPGVLLGADIERQLARGRPRRGLHDPHVITSVERQV